MKSFSPPLSRFKLLFPFFILYVSEGAPIGLIWWVLPAILKDQGIETAVIAAMSATIVLPWTLKFLLGPVVDLYFRTPGRLKIWILTSQAMMGLSLLLVAVDLGTSLNAGSGTGLSISKLTALLLIHCTFAAAQDVGIDTLAIKTIPEKLFGLANGWMQGGMLAGRALIGGAGLWLALEYSPHLAFACVLAILALASVVVLFFRTGDSRLEKNTLPLPQYFLSLWQSVKHKTFLSSLSLAFFAGLSFEGIGVVASPLLKELNLSNALISSFFGLITPVALSLAAILGGMRADRMGQPHGIKESLIGISLAVLVFSGVLAAGSMPSAAFIGSLALVYFAIGWLTSNLYALLMSNADKSLAAIQFSAFMAMTNLSESASGFFMSWGIGALGYPGSFLVLLGVSWISFLLLRQRDGRETSAPGS